MAHVQQCKYCLRNVVNSQWHPECRLAKLEDLLYHTQRRLRLTGNMSVETVAEILSETFRSKEEIEQERKDTEQRRIKKEIWKTNLKQVVQEAVADWQEIHPDPDPPTC